MAFRLYVVPIVVVGAKLARWPKYFNDGTLVDPFTWAGMDYGNEPTMIVGADLSVADDATLAAEPDVQAIPFVLDNLLTGPQVTATQAFLEARNLPVGWVTTALSWRTVVRTILGMFSFLARYAVVYSTANGQPAPSLFAGGVTLATTFGALPAAVQTAMTNTAISLDISTAGLTSGTTLRVILKALADNFRTAPFNFNGTVI